MSGTYVPELHTGLQGDRLLLNGTTTDGRIDNGESYPDEVSFARQTFPTDLSPLIGGLADAHAYGGFTAHHTQTPEALQWNLIPNPHTQYHHPNIFNSRQTPADGHGFTPLTHLPVLDNTRYQLHPSPFVPYPFNNHPLPSFPPFSQESQILANATGLAEQSQDRPLLSIEDWEVLCHTGFLPMRSTAAEASPFARTAISLENDGRLISPPPATWSGTEDNQLAFLPPEHSNPIIQPLLGSRQSTMQHADHTNQSVPSPTLTYVDSQSTANDHDVPGFVNSGGPSWNYGYLNPASIKDQTDPRILSPNVTGLDGRRGSSDTKASKPPPRAIERSGEIKQAKADLERFCRCDPKTRTTKPLRHWEEQCPFNPNKRPRLFCDLPGCRNREGFLNVWNLERHQETASYHKVKE